MDAHCDAGEAVIREADPGTNEKFRWQGIGCLLALTASVAPAMATDMRALDRQLFRAEATGAMRVHRFANIPTLCRLLADDDGAAIHANATAMIAEAGALLDLRERNGERPIWKGFRMARCDRPIRETMSTKRSVVALHYRAGRTTAS